MAKMQIGKWVKALKNGPPTTSSAVRHESPSQWIFNVKDVLSLQDVGLEMLLGDNMTEHPSL